MAKVTILMTSYNHQDYIRESIESVLNQTFRDFELIIVDDCSMDDSFEVINTFKDKRIKAIRNDRNMGPEFAFEILHKTAKSQYIAIADSDNTWEKNKLKKQIDYLDKNPKITAVFTRVNFIDGNGKPFRNKKSKYCKIFDVDNKDRYGWLKEFFYRGNSLCHPSVLIRREAYKECGMVVDGLWQVPDLYKWIKLCLKKDIFVLEDKLVNFRLHGKNVSDENSLGNVLRSNNEFYQIYQLFYKMNSDDFLRVFGKDNKYVVDGKVNVEFALSKMMLDISCPAAQTLGLNKIFEILNDDTGRKQIAKLYDYDDVKYRFDETMYSPYIRNSVRIIKAKLYIDFGEGFNEKDVLTEEYIIDNEGNYSVTFNGITEKCNGKNVKAMRLDLLEDYSKIKIDSCSSERRKIELIVDPEEYLRGRCMKENDYDVFLTNDPAYGIANYEDVGDVLSVNGKVEIIEKEEVLQVKNQQLEDLRESLPKVLRKMLDNGWFERRLDKRKEENGAENK